MEQLIGRTVRVKILYRDDVGKTIPNKFTYISGKCQFAGYNKWLDVWQITIDRMPIFPIQFKDVEIIK